MTATPAIVVSRHVYTQDTRSGARFMLRFAKVFPDVDDGSKYTLLHKWKSTGPIETIKVGLILRKPPAEGVWLERLPVRVVKAICIFLEKYHRRCNKAFDCYAFAFLASDVPDARKHGGHNICTYLTRRRRPGDVVFLYGSEDRLVHAAVYLGWGVYAWAFGKGGPLVFSSLRAMKRGYGAARVGTVLLRISD